MPMMSESSRKIGSPKSALKSASNDVDLQLEYDRQNADLGTQLSSGPTSVRSGTPVNLTLDEENSRAESILNA